MNTEVHVKFNSDIFYKAFFFFSLFMSIYIGSNFQTVVIRPANKLCVNLNSNLPGCSHLKLIPRIIQISKNKCISPATVQIDHFFPIDLWFS